MKTAKTFTEINIVLHLLCVAGHIVAILLTSYDKDVQSILCESL